MLHQSSIYLNSIRSASKGILFGHTGIKNALLASKCHVRRYSPLAGSKEDFNTTGEYDFPESEVSEKVFISPARYVQGRRVINRAAKFVSRIGQRPIVVADDFVWKIAGNNLVSSLKENAGFPTIHQVRFGGEASTAEIGRITEEASAHTGEAVADMVIGIGGGKTMDTAKAVANNLGIRCVIVPTTASTDAPTSALSVIYSEKGSFESYKFYDRNPDLVLVDTSLLVRAPPRFLASGIADACATFLESKPAIQAGSTNMAGGKTTLLGYAIGQKCQDTLFEFSELAMEANRQQVVTPAFEAIVEANTLLSGLGFESGGLGAAHSIHNGIAALGGKQKKLLHGERVAFGCICQLILDNKPYNEMKKFLDLFLRVGLPTTLDELGLENVTHEELMTVAKTALTPGESAYNLPYRLSPRIIYESIVAADAYSKMYKQQIGWTEKFEF